GGGGGGGEGAFVVEGEGGGDLPPGGLTPAVRPARQRNPRLAGAVQDGALVGGVELVERGVEREAHVPGQRFGEAAEGLVVVQVGPGGQGAVAQRAARVADEQGRGGALLDAEALARRAPPERAVEREVVRVERL